ncbi:hypothetical protein E2C01_048735 [Portunus trituberculatus]|uniref:Uncharacterized protein n=1 Tax=Portunus trituberculatus TaxID=210409 RepID=A0A5B7GCE3_PORTR|nr:hypothetical protein [Portunus trituberculatus]
MSPSDSHPSTPPRDRTPSHPIQPRSYPPPPDPAIQPSHHFTTSSYASLPLPLSLSTRTPIRPAHSGTQSSRHFTVSSYASFPLLYLHLFTYPSLHCATAPPNLPVSTAVLNTRRRKLGDATSALLEETNNASAA